MSSAENTFCPLRHERKGDEEAKDEGLDEGETSSETHVVGLTALAGVTSTV